MIMATIGIILDKLGGAQTKRADIMAMDNLGWQI